MSFGGNIFNPGSDGPTDSYYADYPNEPSPSEDEGPPSPWVTALIVIFCIFVALVLIYASLYPPEMSM